MGVSRHSAIDRGRTGLKRVRVSVIVPNHGRDITLLLRSLKKSTVAPTDVLIIDRGFERSIQRNMGIQEAVGENFLVLDSDQSISPGLIEECLELIDAGYASLYIPEIIVAKSFFGKIRAFEREFYTGTAIDVPRFVRADICPLFDEKLNGPEDALWGSKIPGLRAITKNPLYHHDDVPFLEYCKKKAYYSKSMKMYAELNPSDPCLRLKYRCWDVFVQDGKYKKLLKHPILAIGIVVLLAVRGIIFYANR